MNASIEFTLIQLQKEHAKTPALSRAQIIAILRACGLGSIRKYNELIRDKTLIPLRKIGSPAQRARFSRDAVMEVIGDALTQSL